MSTVVIEKDFFDLQKKTTSVLVDQKISEQEKIDIFLDKINELKSEHTLVVQAYSKLIESIVEHLTNSIPVEELIGISECIKNIVNITNRLIESFSKSKYKECFDNELRNYQVLYNDIVEILGDIEVRISGDKEMEDLLADF